MIKRILFATLLAVSSLFAAPANAKVGDAAWAACAWQKAPISAKNWLAMPLPVWSTDIQSASAALALRLAAVCATEAANELKPNREFNWKQMANALERARSASSTASEAASPTVKMCRNYLTKEEKVELFRVDIVRDDEGSQFLVFQQHFASFEDRPVKLPQDLRAVPTNDDGKLSVDCKVISNDGSLTDA
ncbi:MAG TPA: hypothetical protein VF489_03770 [Sphingobium sp.]